MGLSVSTSALIYLKINSRQSRSNIFLSAYHGEPTETSKQPIKTRYLGRVTGYQPIRDQLQSVPNISIIPFFDSRYVLEKEDTMIVVAWPGRSLRERRPRPYHLTKRSYRNVLSKPDVTVMTILSEHWPDNNVLPGC
eukprot:sb/3474573/